MDDPVPVTLESRPYRMEFFGSFSSFRDGAQASLLVEDLFLELLYFFPYRHPLPHFTWIFQVNQFLG
jgi:hypothetical protein